MAPLLPRQCWLIVELKLTSVLQNIAGFCNFVLWYVDSAEWNNVKQRRARHTAQIYFCLLHLPIHQPAHQMRKCVQYLYLHRKKNIDTLREKGRISLARKKGGNRLSWKKGGCTFKIAWKKGGTRAYHRKEAHLNIKHGIGAEVAEIMEKGRNFLSWKKGGTRFLHIPKCV